MRLRTVVILLLAGAAVSVFLSCREKRDAPVAGLSMNRLDGCTERAQDVAEEVRRLADELRTAYDDIQNAVDDAENADLVEDNPWHKVEAFRQSLSEIERNLVDMDTAISDLENQESEIESLCE